MRCNSQLSRKNLFLYNLLISFNTENKSFDSKCDSYNTEPQSESKNRTVYQHPTALEETLTIISGLSAIALLTIPAITASGLTAFICFNILTHTPIAVFILLLLLCRKKTGGYTGDCCGAIFLLTELTFSTAPGSV